VYVEGNILRAELRGIRKEGRLSLVRLLLTIEGRLGTKRYMFGDNRSGSYKKALKEAKEFCTRLKVTPNYHPSLYEKAQLWWPYKLKIDALDDKIVQRIRLVVFNTTLYRVYIRCEGMKTYKEETIVTFGGKNIPKDKANQIAASFCKELARRHSYNLDI
jgi:hypothetical protein